jgi:hypothetical protein
MRQKLRVVALPAVTDRGERVQQRDLTTRFELTAISFRRGGMCPPRADRCFATAQLALRHTNGLPLKTGDHHG